MTTGVQSVKEELSHRAYHNKDNNFIASSLFWIIILIKLFNGFIATNSITHLS